MANNSHVFDDIVLIADTEGLIKMLTKLEEVQKILDKK